MKLLLILLISSILISQTKHIPHREKSLITNGEIHANNVKAIVANNGWLFWGGGASGFVTPSPVLNNNPGNIAAVFVSGIWTVGHVNGEIRAAIANYVTDFIPGDWEEYQTNPILNGRDNPKYKVYYHYSESHISYLENLLESQSDKITDFAQSELLKAQLSNAEWTDAIAQGAPEFPPGDVAAYTIYHDADPDQRESNGISDIPMNIQVRQLMYAYRAKNAVNNTVFVRYEFINKNNVPITDFRIAMWSDVDVGHYDDDLIGSDKDLKIGFAYNGKQNDAQYTDILNLAPPAVGYQFIEGFRIDSLGQNIVQVGEAYSFYSNQNYSSVKADHFIHNKFLQEATGMLTYWDEARTPIEYNYFLQNKGRTGGLLFYQNRALDNGIITDTADLDWAFSGDPETGQGWLDSDPSDRRFVYNIGPIDLGVSNGLENFDDPGYNTVTVAVTSSFGANNLNSVTRLKYDTKVIRNAYRYGFEPQPVLPKLKLTAQSFDQMIKLTWSDSKTDSVLNYTERAYLFEGFQLVEFDSDSNITVIETVDIENDIRSVENIIPNEEGRPLPFKVVSGQNSNIRYDKEITRSVITGDTLLNNNTYRFGIRAYYVNLNPGDGATFAIFSEFKTVNVRPRKQTLGEDISAISLADIIVDRSAAKTSDSEVIVQVKDPYKTTGSTYSIEFKYYEKNTFHLGYLKSSHKSYISNTIIDTIPKGTLGWVVKKNGIEITDLLPQAPGLDEFNYDAYVDGLRISVIEPPKEFNNFNVVANASGLLDPPEMGAFAFNGNGFPTLDGKTPNGVNDRPDSTRQQANGSTWGIHISNDWTAGTSYQDFIEDAGYYMGGINGGLAPGASEGTGIFHAIPNDYEIRFTVNGGRALMRNNSSAQTRIVIDVPFELWNVGPDPDDRSDDYRMVPFIYDRDNTNSWNLLQTDHAVSGGDNDPQMEGITFLDPTNKTPGQAGYNALIAAATADADISWSTSVTSFPYAYNSTYHTVGFNFLALVNWNGGSVSDATWPTNVDALVPETGTIFRISMNKLNTESTVFSFQGPGTPIINDPDIAASEFKKAVTVFPNPFYGSNAQGSNGSDQFITFANLPVITNGQDQVKIDLFSTNGDVINRLTYEDESTEFKWDLRNKYGKKVSNGLVIAVLTYRGKTVIKKILIFKGKAR